MEELLIARPGWLDWSWALSVVDREVRVAGEEVRPADGAIATPYLLADGPLVVTVRARGGQLAVTPSIPALGEIVTRRFHLDLDEEAVLVALDRAGLPGVRGPGSWVRRPAASALWSYCLIFLCGGNPDARPVSRIFAELGDASGHLQIPPEPGALLTAGEHRLIAYGISPHRAANVLGLARAFATKPESYDEVALRTLPAAEAVARIAKLPHIGPTRARTIASTALGHDDVLPDLARQDQQMRRRLRRDWSQLRSSARLAAPFRSISGRHAAGVALVTASYIRAATTGILRRF